MAEVAADHTADWQGLGVSILHRLVIDTLLDAPNLPAPKYVRVIEEVVRGLKHGDAAGRDATGQAGHRRPVPAGRPGDAGHGRAHPHDHQPRRTDAGQEHVLLSEAAQRAGDQSAGVGRVVEPSRALRVVDRDQRTRLTRPSTVSRETIASIGPIARRARFACFT